MDNARISIENVLLILPWNEDSRSKGWYSDKRKLRSDGANQASYKLKYWDGTDQASYKLKYWDVTNQASYKLKYWDGTNQASYKLKCWDGANQASYKLKYWDGTNQASYKLKYLGEKWPHLYSEHNLDLLTNTLILPGSRNDK